jgi:NH3-dependent NAD+ synthetase
MKIIKTEIIPVKLWYYNCKINRLLDATDERFNQSLDLKSIAFFAATGFFFNDSTYFKDIKVVPSASIVEVGDNNEILSLKSFWDWYYNPIITDVEEATEQFKMGFEKNLNKAIHEKKIILPLSGGIDSRVIASALPEGMADIETYSYEFEDGVKEVKFGKAIAEIKNFPFRGLTIPKGYLWDKIDELSEILNHETEYTHSRQIAVIDELEQFGDIFILGHGGEIFKAPQVDKSLTNDGIVDHLYNMFVKEEGEELGEKLWNAWGLEGDFKQYTKDLFSKCLKQIKIKQVNPKLRAFIYKYIASRKNQININVFARNKEIYLPFLNQDVLNGICNMHEDVLTDRKVQINYIKQKSQAIAAVPWQDYYPLNLMNYKNHYKKFYLPIRAVNFAKRVFTEKLNGNKLVVRNWENQFLGKENDRQLQNHLFGTYEDNFLLPKEVVQDIYTKFKHKDNKTYVFLLSTMLTIAHFQKLLVKKPIVPKEFGNLINA